MAQLKKSRNSPRYALKFRWMAGHSGIEGNEEVDEEAKKVVEGMTSGMKNLPLLLKKWIKINKSAMKQHKKVKLKLRWQHEWAISLQYNKFKTLDSSLLSNSFIKLISNDSLSRNNASKICQLRMGHVPLNAFLERIKHVDSAQCPACRHAREDVKHFLLECPVYVHVMLL